MVTLEVERPNPCGRHSPEETMHPFMLVGALLHATALAVLAFFIWFAAAHSTGRLRIFGTILGAWLAFLAIVGIVMAVVWPGHGMGGHMHGWMNREAPPPAEAPANTTAP
jgi:hypothetical protein